MSFQLPNPTPRWAAALGLSIDWQSRVTDPQRTYHSPGRKVELSVGRSPGPFACEVTRWEDHTSLHLAVPRLKAFFKIGSGRIPPLGEMSVDWGVSVYEGDLCLRWGEWSKRWTLNPFHWSGYECARLRSDGEWDSTDHWTGEGKAIDWYEESHPYAITSISYRDAPANKADPRIEITEWNATATCHIERTTRTRRFLSFWKRIEYFVNFSLDNEVGNRSGSWKGGTVGFSERIFGGERVRDVVQRAARHGRGR